MRHLNVGLLGHSRVGPTLRELARPNESFVRSGGCTRFVDSGCPRVGPRRAGGPLPEVSELEARTRTVAPGLACDPVVQTGSPLRRTFADVIRFVPFGERRGLPSSFRKMYAQLPGLEVLLTPFSSNQWSLRARLTTKHPSHRPPPAFPLARDHRTSTDRATPKRCTMHPFAGFLRMDGFLCEVARASALTNRYPRDSPSELPRRA